MMCEMERLCEELISMTLGWGLPARCLTAHSLQYSLATLHK